MLRVHSYFLLLLIPFSAVAQDSARPSVAPASNAPGAVPVANAASAAPATIPQERPKGRARIGVALEGGGIDVEVGAGQVSFGGGGQVRVCLRTLAWGGCGVVLLGDLRAVAHLVDELLLGVEVVTQ